MSDKRGAILVAAVLAACSAPAPDGGPNLLPFGTAGAGGGPTAAGGADRGGSNDLGSTSGAGPTAGLGGGGGNVAGTSGAGEAGGGAGESAGGSAGLGSGGATPGKPEPDARGIYGHPDPNKQYPVYEGFTPYLIEEFDAPLDLAHDPFWTYGDGALYEGMTRMVKENISFENGSLVLRVTDTPQPGAYSFSAADNVAEKPLSSGELRSLYNNFRYGRYEVRMRAPSTGSNYIFTMFAYRTPAYLLWREIDIEVQAAPQNTFITNLITASPGTRLWSPQIEDSTTSYPYGGGGSAIPAGFDTKADYHVYAFEWLPNQIRWFVDDVPIRVKQDGVGKNSLPVPKESTKIVLNLWVFTNQALGGGDPANNVYPIAGAYDWFRFYKWNQDDSYPCLDTPGCLAAADLELAKNNAEDPLPDVRPELCTGEDGMRDAPCGQ